MLIRMLANLGADWPSPWKDGETHECSKTLGQKLVALNLAVDISPPPKPAPPSGPGLAEVIRLGKERKDAERAAEEDRQQKLKADAKKQAKLRHDADLKAAEDKAKEAAKVQPKPVAQPKSETKPGAGPEKK